MDEPITEEHATQPADADETVNTAAATTDEQDMSPASARPDEIVSKRGGRGRRAIRIVAALFVLGLVLAAAGVAYATYDFKNEYDGKILPGATVAGVDVGGMTKDEAIAAVKRAIRPRLQRTIKVTFEKRTWKVTPKELGAESNARAAVRAALDASGEASWTDLAGMRLLGDKLDIAEDVSIRYSKKGARSFVESLAGDVNQDPVDAAIDYSSGWVKITKEREGYELAVGKSTRSLMSAIENRAATSELDVRALQPAVTSDDFERVILVRQSDFRVYLYEDGKITDDWPVAVGQPRYPTPTGEFEVELKRYMPTWVNPQPDGWGADMPAEIPPGPSNPLGLRAINWTAPGIRFHGTSATSSIGTAASHGCVRMLNSDVIQLYNQVEVGDPIISLS